MKEENPDSSFAELHGEEKVRDMHMHINRGGKARGIPGPNVLFKSITAVGACLLGCFAETYWKLMGSMMS